MILSRASKAQAGLEYLATVAIVLVILIPVFYYGYQDSVAKTRIAQAELAVAEIASAVDFVFAQSPGSKTTIEVYMPGGINSTYVGGKLVNINIRGTSVLRVTKGNVSGTLPTGEGTHFLAISYNETTGAVNIG